MCPVLARNVINVHALTTNSFVLMPVDASDVRTFVKITLPPDDNSTDSSDVDDELDSESGIESY